MVLTVDIGNTRVKRAFFEGDRLMGEGEVRPDCQIERAIVCASGRCDLPSLNLGTDRVHLLSCRSKLPIAVDYATPETLGPDRVAAACGAWKLCAGEGRCCLVVDAGTCITIDYLDASGTFRGGAILPGIGMKYRALHTFTSRLPLLTQTDEEQVPLTGRSTRQSMAAGVLLATRFAVEGFAARYREQEPGLRVLLTGGDAHLLREGMEAGTNCSVEPDLVMIGLNEILKRNEE